MALQFSAIIAIFTGIIIIITFNSNAEGHALDGTSSQKRDIFFNRDDYDTEHQEAKERLFNISLQICPKKRQEIEEKIEEFKKCSGQINEDEKMMCEVIEENLKTCIVPLFNLFESCVPEKIKGFPTYILRTANSTLEYLCNLNGAHLLELSNPCILRKNHPYSRKCIRKLKKEILKYNYDNLPQKQAICRFLEDFKNCFQTHLENACQDSVTREAYLGLYERLMCKN